MPVGKANMMVRQLIRNLHMNKHGNDCITICDLCKLVQAFGGGLGSKIPPCFKPSCDVRPRKKDVEEEK